jgi:hypothetical protein
VPLLSLISDISILGSDRATVADAKSAATIVELKIFMLLCSFI